MKKSKKLSKTILKYILSLSVSIIAVLVTISLAGTEMINRDIDDMIIQFKKKKNAENAASVENEINKQIKADSTSLALQYSEILKQFTQMISLCDLYIESLYNSPENVGEGNVVNRGEKSGNNMFYCLPKGTTYEQYQREINMIGCADILFSSIMSNMQAAAVYFVTDDGIMIAMDDNSNERIEEMTDSENIEYFGKYKPLEREWYTSAKEAEGNYIFSEVYKDVAGENVITCSKAVYSERGFEGVVGIDYKYDSLINSVVSDTDRGYEEYSKIVTEKGKPFVECKDFEYNDINVFQEDRFIDFKNSLIKEENSQSLVNDYNSIYKKVILKRVDIGDNEYICAGYNFAETNLYFVMFVDGGNASTDYVREIGGKLRDYKELSDNSDRIFLNMMMILFAMGLIMVFIVIKVSRVISGQIVRPINKLIEDVQEIGKGRLEHKVNINTNDELEVLGNVFNNMTESLQEYMVNLKNITMEQEKISAELNVASAIQSNMLPKDDTVSQWGDYGLVYADMKPAKEVGGDYYDYFMVEDRYLFFVVADVSGKGVPAALFMMMGKTLMGSQAIHLKNPAEIMNVVNKSLNENNEEMMFITSFMCVLDMVTGELSYANAGHNAPLIYSDSLHKYEYLKQNVDLVLAVMEDTEYLRQSVMFKPGDKIFLYTDGVTEAANDKEELYGEDRLLEYINKDGIVELSGRELIKNLSDDIKKFVNGAAQSDDITMLSFLFKKYKAVKNYGKEKSEIIVAADLSMLDELLDFAHNALKNLGISDENIIYNIDFVLDEMFSNIAKYSYRDGMVEVNIRMYIDNNNLIVEIEDNGAEYNPLQKEDPDINASLEEREVGGLGIFLVKQSVKEMKYKYDDEKNKVCLVIGIIPSGVKNI